MMKMTKSWKLTLISFIVVMAMPVINGPLVDYGIVITEQELQHFLFVFFGVSAAGGGMSMYKKRVNSKKPNTVVHVDPQGYVVETPTPKSDVNDNAWKKAFEESAVEGVKTTRSVNIPDESPSTTVTIPDPKQVKATSIPELGPVGETYQTNFVKDPLVGNVLSYGAPYLFARMAGARSYVTGLLRDEGGRIIQVEQSKPGEEIIRFELKNRLGQRLPRGTYNLQVQADSGSGDSQGIKRDEFQIA